jgi:hypothetical protein
MPETNRIEYKSELTKDMDLEKEMKSRDKKVA